jgi:DNA repair exonuclease SbcCD ATPase subunit
MIELLQKKKLTKNLTFKDGVITHEEEFISRIPVVLGIEDLYGGTS